MSATVALYLEIGPRRVFAGALDWPGWCRGGLSEEAAIENLLAHQDRYAAVVARAGLPFVGEAREAGETGETGEAAAFEIAERLRGGAATDFGAPGIPPAADARPMDAGELDRQARLLRACWEVLEAVLAAARASGMQLATGPRGGGRDLDKIESHVAEAELAYLSQLGSRAPRPTTAPLVREAALGALAARAGGEPVPNPSAVRTPWSPRYFVRRSAWHTLDHAWEIEDRSG